MKNQRHLLLSSPRQKRLFKLVRRGYALHVQLLQLSDQLHIIEGMLKAEALNRPFEHFALVDSDAGTVEWLATAPGCECHIVVPGATLQTDFTPSRVDWRTIHELCGLRLSHLFTISVNLHIADPVVFREKVEELFSPLDGARLIRLCSVTPKARCIWNECPPPVPPLGSSTQAP